MSAYIPRTLAAIIGISLTSGAALAQSPAGSPFALTVPGRVAEAARSEYNPSEVRAQLDNAHRLCEQGRFKEGRRAYAAIARLQRANNVLPDEALWNLANLYHGSGNLQRSAQVMDELAQAAELHGNPVVQAKALVEAAILYHTLGQRQEAAMRIERLQPLLSSPYLSNEVRTEIQSRITE